MRSRALQVALVAILSFGSLLTQTYVVADAATPAVAYTGIKLPYPRGVAYNVNQTPGAYQACPGNSHCGTQDFWAYDFNLGDGALVSAVRNGTVIRMVMGSVEGGCNDIYNDSANYIVLDHGDGKSSIYWHLQYATNIVGQGQILYQGQPLARADSTGHVCGNPPAHLHFAVETTPPQFQSLTNSLQVSFDEAGEPVKDSDPMSQNRIAFSASYLGGSEWVTLATGQRHTTVGQWKNEGYQVWQFNVAGYSARLGTSDPIPGLNQNSLIGGPAAGACLASTSWFACNRIRPTTDLVAPGQTGWFQFELIGPASPGVYKLYLRPVIEGITWMEDFGVFWQVTR